MGRILIIGTAAGALALVVWALVLALPEIRRGPDHSLPDPAQPTVYRAAGLFEQGQFLKAAQQARALTDTPAAQALAARAFLAEAVLHASGPPRLDLAKQGLEAASQALTLDPDHMEAHLQSAVALGLLGRAKNPIEAHTDGLAVKAKRHIRAALAQEPDNPYALLLDGTWHLEIVAEAGPVLGDMLYRADRDQGLAQLRAAAAHRQAPVLVRVQATVALLAAGMPAHREGAQGILEAVLASAPASGEPDAISAAHRKMAQHLLDAMDAGEEAVWDTLKRIRTGPAVKGPAMKGPAMKDGHAHGH